MVVQVVPANPREVCRLVEQDCGVPFTTQVGKGDSRHASRITTLCIYIIMIPCV